MTDYTDAEMKDRICQVHKREQDKLRRLRIREIAENLLTARVARSHGAGLSVSTSHALSAVETAANIYDAVRSIGIPDRE